MRERYMRLGEEGLIEEGRVQTKTAKRDGGSEGATTRDRGIGVNVTSMLKVCLGSRGKIVKTTNVAPNWTPVVASRQSPCKRPAVKDAAVAATVNNIISFVRPIHGAICTQIRQVSGMSKAINERRTSLMRSRVEGMGRGGLMVMGVGGSARRGMVGRRAISCRANGGGGRGIWSEPGKFGLKMGHPRAVGVGGRAGKGRPGRGMVRKV
jgi:hypothetical protein